MKYFVFPDTQDGCQIATRPWPVELRHVGQHIAAWKSRFARQGYFSNCKKQRLSLDAMQFRIVPESEVSQ
jgi:hypothetical protein